MSWSRLQLSPVAMNFRKCPKELDHRQKWAKAMGWGAQTSGRSSELNCSSSASQEVSRVGSGICFRFLLDTSHVQLGRDHWAEPGQAGGITHPFGLGMLWLPREKLKDIVRKKDVSASLVTPLLSWANCISTYISAGVYKWLWQY